MTDCNTYVSTANGMHAHPSSMTLYQWHCSAKAADLVITSNINQSGYVMVMLNVAGLPNNKSTGYQHDLYDAAHAQDHFLLLHGHQCKLATVGSAFYSRFSLTQMLHWLDG